MTIKIDVPGEQWGRREKRWVSVRHRRMEVHHDVYPRHPDPAHSARRIQAQHEADKRFNGIFYCVVLHHSGVTLEGRGFNRQSKGNGSDGYSLTVVLTGNYETTDYITPAQAEVLREYDRHFAEPTVWHKQRASSDCPGRNAISWLENNLAGGQPTKGEGPVIYGIGYTRNGPGVEQIQRMLRDLGVAPGLEVDGVFGPNTTAAVREWQRRLGVVTDGVWGPDTQEATDNFFNYLAAAGPGKPKPKPSAGSNSLVIAKIRAKQAEIDSLLSQIR